MVSNGTISASKRPACLARGGAALAFQRVGILALAGDLVALGDEFGGVDHRHVDVGLVLDQPIGSAARNMLVVLHQADAFQAAADGHRHAVHCHAVGRNGDGLQAGAALAVHGGAGGGDRQAGADGGLARDVAAGGTLLQRAAEDHVLDLIGIDLGAADGVGDDVAAHGGAVRVVERPAIGPPMGVRAVDTMTASRMQGSLNSCFLMCTLSARWTVPDPCAIVRPSLGGHPKPVNETPGAAKCHR